MAKLKDYWLVVGIAVSVLAFGWWLRMVDAKAGEAKSIAIQQAEINAKLSAVVLANDVKLSVYLELMGFDDSIAREWSTFPREPQKDSMGRPEMWSPWLEMDSGLQVGVRYMLDDSLELLVDTLWDMRPKDKP